MINCDRIAQALIDYDPDAQEARVEKAEDQRVQLLARFPKDGWPEMTLDRYALGKPDHPDNFCRWMEFVTADMGSIKGGSARKHLIYYQAEAGRWWFNEKLYPNVEEAWNAVHTGFLKAIEYAEAGEWDEIERIDALRSAPALRNKTLWAYFPDALMPINSQSHLRHYLRELGDPQANDQSLSTIKLSRRLLEGLRACGPVASWTTQQLAHLLYATYLDRLVAQTSVPEFSVGQRVRLRRRVERYPHAAVPEGTLGTIALIGPAEFSIRPDIHIDGLEEWGNELRWANAELAAEDLEPSHEAARSVPRYFTTYWRAEPWYANEGRPVAHAASNEFAERGVSEGDVLYVLHYEERNYYLGARLHVGAVLGQREAEAHFGSQDIWEADDHVLAAPGTEEELEVSRLVPRELLKDLTFLQAQDGSKSGIKFTADGAPDQQTLRTVRQLTQDSARLLDGLIERS